MFKLNNITIISISYIAFMPPLVAFAEEELVRIFRFLPVDFDVTRQLLGTEEHMFFDFSEGLITFDEKGELVGGIADRWTVSDDGKRYDFHLRENAKWSNGDPITAQDFVRSLHVRLARSRAGEVATYKMIGTMTGISEYMSGETDDLDAVGVKAIDDHQLSITFTEASLYQLNEFSTEVWLPLHEDWQDIPPDGKDGFLPTSGAYTPVEFRPDDTLVVEKNPHYYDTENVSIDRVIFRAYQGETQMVNSETAIYKALLNGEIDIANEVKSDVIEWFGEHHPEFLFDTDFLAFNFLEFNLRNPALADPEIRRALGISLDLDALTEIAGMVQLAQMNRWYIDDAGDMPPSRIVRDERPYEERVAEARQILESKGYTADAPLVLNFRQKSDPISASSARAIAGMWGGLGVRVNHLTHDEVYTYYTEYLMPGDFDVAIPSWTGITPDHGYFINMAHSNPEISGGMNFGQYQSAEFDAAIDRANAAKTIESRNDALVDAEKILVEDYGKLPLSRELNYFLVAPKVADMGDGRFGHYLSRHIRLREDGRDTSQTPQ